MHTHMNMDAWIYVHMNIQTYIHMNMHTFMSIHTDTNTYTPKIKSMFCRILHHPLSAGTGTCTLPVLDFLDTIPDVVSQRCLNTPVPCVLSSLSHQGMKLGWGCCSEVQHLHGTHKTLVPSSAWETGTGKGRMLLCFPESRCALAILSWRKAVKWSEAVTPTSGEVWKLPFLPLRALSLQ